MDANRQFWNQQHKSLRINLQKTGDFHKTVETFLDLHSMVHSSAIAEHGLYSFDDELWQGTSEAVIRRIPANHEHSIAWIIWHIARIEDITINILLADSPQVFRQALWLEELKVQVQNSGNRMTAEEVEKLSHSIGIEALREYRLAVGRRTREIVPQLDPNQMKKKIEQVRLQRIWVEGGVKEEASGLIDYWSGLTRAGLLLMPPTRHNFLHLNEAIRIKRKK